MQHATHFQLAVQSFEQWKVEIEKLQYIQYKQHNFTVSHTGTHNCLMPNIIKFRLDNHRHTLTSCSICSQHVLQIKYLIGEISYHSDAPSKGAS
ncbi:unnamed protein product [Urochloa humidicola]